MTPERWQQVKEIFNSAIAYRTEQRNEFLSRVCSGDESLRSEVESLIEAHEKTGSFIDSPAYDGVTMESVVHSPVTVGQVFGRYRVLSAIGHGGMGEVYLAEDTTLGRRVALKFLPALVARDQVRLGRFEQEARATSALNHPNIITIYEVGLINGCNFIAAEYVDGETLRCRLENSRPNLPEAVDIAIQIVAALSAAHQAGIVHRDIKPENIMLRADGIVKVLDFGLAKLTYQVSANPEEATRRLVMTSEGIVMGTVAYMSPEQARALPVDARTDIWSLGVVLYEMLTGCSPFIGPTASDMVAAILEREPEQLNSHCQVLPAELDRIVTKAIRKKANERYQTCRDLLVDLKSLQQQLVHPSTVSPQARPWRYALSASSKAAILVLAIVTASLVSVTIYNRFIRKDSTARTAPLKNVGMTMQLTTWPGLDVHPALSPDGNSVAYSSDHNGSFEIYVKQLTPGSRENQLTSDGAQNFDPTWAPDGKFIAFASKGRGGIWVVPSSGGTPRQLTESGANPAWSPDGSQIVFQSEGDNGNLGATDVGPLSPSILRVVSSQGGASRALTQVGSPNAGHCSPSWSPDGSRIVFVAYNVISTDLWSISAQGTDLRQVTNRKSYVYDPVFSPDGQHLYFGGIAKLGGFVLYRLPVLPTNGKSEEEPAEIFNSGLSRIKHLSISSDGSKLAYSAPTMRGTLFSLTLSPTGAVGTRPAQPLLNESSYRKGLPVISPDGQKIAFVEFRGGTNQDIWVMDIDGNNPVQVTTDPAIDWAPSWFPDSDKILFQSFRNGRDGFWSVSLTSGREKLEVDIDGYHAGWPKLSTDGNSIVFNSSRGGTINTWLVPLAGGTPKQLTSDSELMGFACWSRDDRYLALEVKRGRDQNVAVLPSQGGNAEWLTTSSGSSWPASWSPDDDKIAFAGQRKDYWNIYWVSRSTKEQRQLTSYKKLNSYVRYPFWSPDGKRIVYEYSESTGNIWLMELK